MGRKKVKESLARTDVVQFRCSKMYKDRLVRLSELGQYRDLTEMIEAMVERERQRLGDEPFPPR
jgi:hypothetical protein